MIVLRVGLGQYVTSACSRAWSLPLVSVVPSAAMRQGCFIIYGAVNPVRPIVTSQSDFTVLE
jgi:hypothetical protein